MSWFSTVMDGFSSIRADVSGTPAPWDDYWYTPIGVGSASGMRVSPESVKRISTALACVSKIAKTVAMLPRSMYTETAEGKTMARQHPLHDLLRSSPNTQQTSFEFFQMMQGHLELRGNAFAEIKPGPRGAVDQLIPMHPDRVTIEPLQSGRLRYIYNDPRTNMDRKMVQEEVFHVRNFMDDGIKGQSTVAMAIDVFGIALAAQDYYARFLKNDARPSLAITGAVFKNESDRELFINRWQRAQTEGNRFKVAALSPGMDVKQLGMLSKDAELLDSRKFSREEICAIFDMPPRVIGISEKGSSYNSAEQDNITFATYCILPRVILWEQAIDKWLVTSAAYFPEFNLEVLLRGDTKSRYDAYHVAIGDGWMNQDEARAKEGLNPIPEGVGKNHWRPANWARLEDKSNAIESGNGSGRKPGEPPPARPGEGDQAALLRSKVQLLAMRAADPCVRKEVNALRRLSQHSHSAEEFRAQVNRFYSEHAAFVQERMKLPAEEARQYCDRNRQFVLSLPEPLALNGQLDAMLHYSTQLLGQTAAEVIQ